MSRTHHHGYKAKDRLGRNDFWCRNEPKLWRRLQKHKKRRAACRALQTKALRGEEGLIWPLDSKPWNYYW